MAHQSPDPILVPPAAQRIDVRTTGEYSPYGPLQDTVAQADEARILFTEGINDCRVLATYNPNHVRTLCHANGGLFTDVYINHLAGFIQPGVTDVIMACGVSGSQDYFITYEVPEFQGRLNAALEAAGHPPNVHVIAYWSPPGIASTFFIQRDGLYGRCTYQAGDDGGGGTGCCSKCVIM